MTERAPSPRAQRGLTLLEVLAAAMIFAMVMTVLVGTSSTAVQRSGIAARRLEAKLLADDVLADLEIQMAQRIAPELTETEITQEPFEVSISRSSLSGDDNGFAGDGTNLSLGSAGDVTALLGAELPEVVKHLQRYDIEVRWLEGDGPQTLTRTTFAFDWQAAALEFAELFPGQESDDEPALEDAEALSEALPEAPQ